jgi:ABC-2 type transport system permease protein
MTTLSLQRTFSVARKELIHLLRDPTTMFFALFIPVVQLILLGAAIDTNVKHIRTAVCDLAQTQESREFLRALVNSEDFNIVEEVYRDEELTRLIIAGRVHVGVKIPEDFSRQLQAGATAQILVLVDGSDSSVAGEAVNVANAVALRESLTRILGDKPLPIDSRPRVLFNPDTRSPNFFLPGLLVVLCQMMATMLTANAIVREKENGTLEQLYMTPVQATEVILGKLAPYLVLAFVEFFLIVTLMVTIFQVPIHGHLVTLAALFLPFVLTMLGVGLLISARCDTLAAASQAVIGTVMPSIFLSGYIFPIDSMPIVFQYVARIVPTTWLIDGSRGVILRGAGWAELWPNFAVLSGMAVTILLLASFRFRKQL